MNRKHPYINHALHGFYSRCVKHPHSVFPFPLGENQPLVSNVMIPLALLKIRGVIPRLSSRKDWNA